MYAEIVPNTKTDLQTQTFTYQIPPEILGEIRLGSLVLIPFGKRNIEGIIVKKTQKLKLKTKNKQLKPILKILQEEPVVDQVHLKLAKWMAEYYLAPLSLCLFEMLAIPPKRKVKTKKVETPSPITHHLSPKLKAYLKLAKRALSKNKQVIILFPEINFAQQAFYFFQKEFGKKVAVFHGELNKTLRFSIWQKIKEGEINIVLGSRLCLFSPLNRLGLIIIDNEESESYKNERQPRYNAKTIAKKLAKLTGAKLVLFSQTPSIESYWETKKKKFYLLRPKLLAKSLTQNLIVDMQKEIQKRNYSPFSETLKNALKKTLAKKEQAILFINRKGAATYIFCRDCGYVLRCPNCEIPLIYHPSDFRSQISNLICHHCQYKTEPPFLCPNCQGIHLKYWGIGTETIEMEIKKMFVKPDVLRIDKDLPLTPDPLSLTPDIIIGTQKLLSFWQKPIFLVAVISLDLALNLPDFRQGERVFSLISYLKSLSKNLFILQTNHPENFVIKKALLGNYQDFYQEEIENRKKANYPPFSRLVRLLSQNKNKEKCQEEADLVAEKLKLQIENCKLKIDMLGPSPCFIEKERGKYRFQILLKIPPSYYLTSKIYHLVSTLPSNWTVDVEPTILL